MRFQPRMLFTVGAAALFACVVLTARHWPLGARLFPWAIGIPMLVLCLVQLALEIYRSGRAGISSKESYTADLQVDWEAGTPVVIRNASSFFGWLIGLVLAIWLIGFFWSVPLFTFLYLKLQAREGWGLSLALTVAVLMFLIGLFEQILHVPWPRPVWPWPEAMFKSLLPWVD